MEKGFGRTEAYGETKGVGRPSAKPKGTGARKGLGRTDACRERGMDFNLLMGE